VAYVTDNELAGMSHGVGPGWRNGLVDFLQGVHTVVHDATWPESRLAEVSGWGHSSPAQAVALARDAGCRRLVLFHHNPEFDDAAVDRHLAGGQAVARGLAPDLEVMAAIEGDVIVLEGGS
jgi:ribonuclease BN (tRNA processing enzyme)